MLSLKSTLAKGEGVDTTAETQIEDRLISSCAAICGGRSTGSSNGTDANDSCPGGNCTGKDIDAESAGSVSFGRAVRIDEEDRSGRMGKDTVPDTARA